MLESAAPTLLFPRGGPSLSGGLWRNATRAAFVCEGAGLQGKQQRAVGQNSTAGFGIPIVAFRRPHSWLGSIREGDRDGKRGWHGRGSGW